MVFVVCCGGFYHNLLHNLSCDLGFFRCKNETSTAHQAGPARRSVALQHDFLYIFYAEIYGWFCGLLWWILPQFTQSLVRPRIFRCKNETPTDAAHQAGPARRTERSATARFYLFFLFRNLWIMVFVVCCAWWILPQIFRQSLVRPRTFRCKMKHLQTQHIRPAQRGGA